MLYTKFYPNISSVSRGKVDSSGLAILATAAIFDSRAAEFYFSEALQPCHAAFEI